jgi:hypothetical protein
MAQSNFSCSKKNLPLKMWISPPSTNYGLDLDDKYTFQ